VRVRLAAPFLIFLVLIACQKDQPLPQHEAPASAPAADSTPATTEAPAQTTTMPADPVSAPAAAAGGVATSEGEKPGFTLTVTELKRASGGTVTLKFTIANGGTESMSFGNDMVDPSNSGVDYNSIGGVHLIDPVNKKKFFVVRDSDNRCLCSRDLGSIAPGKALNLWAKFPAPPDVPRVSVVVPHFMPMDDVPIS